VILVDTSIVIDYARGKNASLSALIPTVGAAICGIVRAELLCGARDTTHRAALHNLLATFHQIPISDSLWDTVGQNLAALHLHGLTLPFPDVVIATLGIDRGLRIWSTDPHFTTMQSTLPQLQLYHPPP
jgi:predicted nucleic acid-binding protein